MKTRPQTLQYPTSATIIQKTDQQYFMNLKHYKPICYNGVGTPKFLKTKEWYNPVCCATFITVIGLVALIFYIIKYNRDQQNVRDQYFPLWVPILATFVLIILGYLSIFLTLFLNPGIINPSSLSSKIPKQKLGYCKKCCHYKTQDMNHCNQCEVCIEGLDHHCGYFSKCIGGCQKFAFYSSLLFGFLYFMLILMICSMVLM